MATSASSSAFNHVERREKRRLVFAKSLSACTAKRIQSVSQSEEKGCLLSRLSLSLIINNENGGVKSCRCAMPNAGISFYTIHGPRGWILAFISLFLAEHNCEVPVNGHLQWPSARFYSNSVIWPGAISYAIVCTSKSANCTTAPPMGRRCECECENCQRRVNIKLISLPFIFDISVLSTWNWKSCGIVANSCHILWHIWRVNAS